MNTKTLVASLVLLAWAWGPPASAEDVSWSLETPAGETVSFPNEHDGPVILLFWATWCPYCKALMPHLQSMLDEYGDDGLTILAINFRDDGDPVEYLRSQGFGFTLLPNGGDVAKSYDVHATPGLLLFDRENRLVLNVYDVMDDYNERFSVPDDLKHSLKAARKAPWWAARIREALDATLR